MNVQRRQQATGSFTTAQSALDWLVKRGIEPVPGNFEVAFLYCEGSNTELNRAIEEADKSSVGVDEHTLQQIYRQHVRRESDAVMISALTEQMTSELANVLQSMDRGGKERREFGQALSQASSELGSASPSDTSITTVVGRVLDATRAMEARNKALEQELQNSSREMSNLRERLDTAKREGLTDALTKISNRKAFDKELQRLIEQASKGDDFCLVLGDIDHFKKFNDTWGHPIGDQVLRYVATCLTKHAKGLGMAARYGGEEFALLLSRVKAPAAVSDADRIREEISTKKLMKKNTGESLGRVTISAGVAQFEPGDSAADILRRADQRLYAAKHAGCNRVIAVDAAESAIAVA